MLRFVLGTAGSGKTTRLIRYIKDVAESGGKVILLVPEQFSFEGEKLLYGHLGPQVSLRVEVLSFTRLCNSIFRRFGGLAGASVTPAAKTLLMSVAVEQLRDSLRVYGRSCRSTAFLETLVSTCGEMKTAGITPRALELCAGSCGEEPLGRKVRELADIYGAYQALLDRGYLDPDDDLIRACSLLEEGRDFFADYTVFVDGFTTFMAAEFRLFGHIVAQAAEVYVALTADGLHDSRQGMGVFSPAQKAAQRLIRMAGAAGVPVAAPEILPGLPRYKNEELAGLSRSLFRPGADPIAAGEPQAVRLYAAADGYDEARYAAAQIARLVREEGYRYREIAVVARDTGPYERAVETMFARYGIPCFLSAREDIENTPLIGAVLGAVDAVRSNYDSETVLSFAKSTVLGLDPVAVAALENYCYIWGVRGAAWLGPFGGNPRGMAGPLTEEDIALLEQVNETRAAVIGPLEDLKRAIGGGTGRSFAAGIYELLRTVRAAENLTESVRGLEGENAFLDSCAQTWDMLMDILDIFGAVLGEGKLPPGRLCELFRLATASAETASPPQTLDQVIVGGADRIRPARVRAVFVLGANEGVFPAQLTASGVFTDRERRRLIEAGVEISAPALEQSVLEQYFAYFALTLPEERLFVSCARSDLNGREMMPSMIVRQLEALFPGLKPHRPGPLDFAAGGRSAFQLLAEHYREDTSLAAALRFWFAGQREAGALKRMEYAACKPPHRLTDYNAVRGLFGGRMRLSPSRVERYYRCPFSYFASDGLGLKKRGKVEFSPLESGSVIHNVLQVVVQRHGGKGLAALSEEQLAREVEEVISGYLAERVEGAEQLPARFQYLFKRLTGTLVRLLRRLGEEFAQSEFEPVAFELPISAEEGVEPLRLVTADGVPVTVEGVVDRVDILEKNGAKYLRVVDYKSGGKDFKLQDILYGLNLQMLLYLFTVVENGRGRLGGAVPAGVLYMPARESYLTGGRDCGEEEAKDAQRAKWRMSGLLLEDEEVLRGMEPDLAGVFIPAKMGKGGLDAKSSLAGKAELGRLSRKVRELVVQMAESLAGGGIGARPTNSPDHDACAYCDYRAVCGFEQGDPVREIAKLDREAVLKRLEEEEDRHV